MSINLTSHGNTVPPLSLVQTDLAGYEDSEKGGGAYYAKLVPLPATKGSNASESTVIFAVGVPDLDTPISVLHLASSHFSFNSAAATNLGGPLLHQQIMLQDAQWTSGSALKRSQTVTSIWWLPDSFINQTDQNSTISWHHLHRCRAGYVVCEVQSLIWINILFGAGEEFDHCCCFGRYRTSNRLWFSGLAKRFHSIVSHSDGGFWRPAWSLAETGWSPSNLDTICFEYLLSRNDLWPFRRSGIRALYRTNNTSPSISIINWRYVLVVVQTTIWNFQIQDC